MATISLRSKMQIDSTSYDDKFLAILNNVKPFLQDIPRRLWPIMQPITWDEIRYSKPQQVQEINSEITDISGFYLRTVRPKLPNLLDRHQPRFVSYEVQLENVDLSNYSDLQLAVYFFSEQYQLIEKFSYYLLLSKIEDVNTNSNETFMVALSSDLSIHTYNQ